MDEEQIKQLLQSHRRSGGRRGFRCPDEQRLAAYVDGQITGNERTSLEKHVSACDSCLDAIAFLADSAEWLNTTEVPAYLIARARALVREKPGTIWRWRWALATAAAACVVLALTFIVLRSRVEHPTVPDNGNLVAQNLPTPEALATTPIVGPLEPLPTRSLAKPNLNRGETPAVRGSDNELRPTLLFPREDSVVRRDELEFRWLPGAEAVSYELRLAAADGSLKFTRETKDLRLNLGDDVELQEGALYYVTIVAQSSDGRFTRSEIVSFRLAKN